MYKHDNHRPHTANGWRGARYANPASGGPLPEPVRRKSYHLPAQRPPAPGECGALARYTRLRSQTAALLQDTTALLSADVHHDAHLPLSSAGEQLWTQRGNSVRLVASHSDNLSAVALICSWLYVGRKSTRCRCGIAFINPA